MAVRYRWYRIRLSRDQDLVRLLARKPLSEGSTFGFYRTGGSPSESSFRFFWRTTLVATRYGEDGEPTYEQVQSLSVLNFSVLNIGRLLFIRVENPNRNLRELMNALESLSGFGFSCAPIAFEQMRPKQLFEEVDESKLVSLKVVGAVIGEELVARMEFASKMGIRPEKLKALSGLQYKIDVAVFECLYQGVKGQISISASGVVRLTGPLSPRLVHFIQKELPELSKLQS